MELPQIGTKLYPILVTELYHKNKWTLADGEAAIDMAVILLYDESLDAVRF